MWTDTFLQSIFSTSRNSTDSTERLPVPSSFVQRNKTKRPWTLCTTPPSSCSQLLLGHDQSHQSSHPLHHKTSGSTAHFQGDGDPHLNAAGSPDCDAGKLCLYLGEKKEGIQLHSSSLAVVRAAQEGRLKSIRVQPL